MYKEYTNMGRGETNVNRFGKILLAAALFGSGLGIGTLVTSSADGVTTAPGTANDPIVTKSYVDEAIKSLTGVTPNTGTPAPSTSTGSGTASASSARLVVVELKPGQTLAAGEGTEFIVRNGKAIAYSSTEDGISDLTDGIDLKPGVVIPTNHLLLFPREGRGIRPHKDSTGTIYVMVRGAYSHIGEDGTVLK
jgi:hypothetical protein